MKILNETIKNILYVLPHKLSHSIIYWHYHHRTLNWRNPQLYDEKIHWLMVKYYGKEYGKYADKYKVRSYVEECGLKNILIPIIGIIDSVKVIDYDELPKRFILKATHGSGKNFYEICQDKKQLNVLQVNKKLRKALKTNFAKCHCEYHYQNIHPRVICEKLLSGNDKCLTDYKVVCTNGHPNCILVCTNRDEGRDYYTTDWKYLDYVKEEYRSKIRENAPYCLTEMLQAASLLSKPFPLARIDFYVVDNKLYFGEITLTPGAGNHKYLNIYGQYELGRMIDLPS